MRGTIHRSVLRRLAPAAIFAAALTGTLAAPSGASRMVLTVKAPATLPTGTTMWFDDVWVW